MKFLLPWVSAYLVSLSFEPYGIWILLIPALWIMTRLLFVEEKKLLNRVIHFASFVYGINLFGFYWLAYTFHDFGHLPWVAAIPMSVTMLFLASLASALWAFIFFRYVYPLIERKTPGEWGLFLGIFVFYLAWEYFDYRFFGWSIVMGFGSNELLLASVGYLKTHGWRIYFFLFIALSFVFLIQAKKQGKFYWKTLLASLVFLLIPASLGAINRKNLKKFYARSQPVLMLQGNIGNFEKKIKELDAPPSFHNIVKQYRNLVEKAAIEIHAESIQDPWVVWPETALPILPISDEGARQQVEHWVRLTKGSHIIGGYEENPESGNDFNVSMLFDDNGYVDRYRKNILIPFGEYFPGDFLYPDIYKKFPVLNHFSSGGEQKVLVNRRGVRAAFIPLICYELLSESFVNQFVDSARKNYPDFPIVIVNQTNDSWFGPTSQPYLHAQLHRWHAARLKLPIIRSTNTGISQLVAPWGESLISGPMFQADVIVGQLPIPAAD